MLLSQILTTYRIQFCLICLILDDQTSFFPPGSLSEHEKSECSFISSRKYSPHAPYLLPTALRAPPKLENKIISKQKPRRAVLIMKEATCPCATAWPQPWAPAGQPMGCAHHSVSDSGQGPVGRPWLVSKRRTCIPWGVLEGASHEPGPSLVC